MKNDIRVLCRSCAERYIEIGYKLKRVKDFKDECFICSKRGFEYEIKKRGGVSGKGRLDKDKE